MIIQGDCLEKLKELEDNSIDSVVTDPPYGLSFMGKKWDYDVPSVKVWKECIRVLKPGGYLLSFAGTRTYHRMAVNIEDAGFEIRDMIAWTYASGFPKSLNLFKQFQKRCTCGNMEAYDKRTKTISEHDLRPVREEDIQETEFTKKEQGEALQSVLSEQGIQVQQSKSSENVRKGQSSMERGSNLQEDSRKLQGSDVSEMPERVSGDGKKRRLRDATQIGNGSIPEKDTEKGRSGTPYRSQSEQQQDREPCAFCKQYRTQALGAYGFGSALKPAFEPIVVARKPISEKNLADNFLKWGTGGINIDGSRVEIEKDDDIHAKNPHTVHKKSNIEFTSSNGEPYKVPPGRFPANFIHDGSEEVERLFPNTKSGGGNKANKQPKNRNSQVPSTIDGGNWSINEGSASRFFYCAKASKSERQAGNNHPTVKPISLMEYLIKMVTPKDGIVLDSFFGSGSTGVACVKNGFKFIGIELEEEYIKIAEARIKATKMSIQEVLL